MAQQKLQHKYMQLQLLRQQLSALAEQKNAVDERLSELSNTREALERLVAIEKGSEIWSPFGSGAFVRSDIKDTEKVLIAVGAGVVIREKRDAAIKILEARTAELESIAKLIMQEAGRYAEQAERAEKELEQLAAAAQKEQSGKDAPQEAKKEKAKRRKKQEDE